MAGPTTTHIRHRLDFLIIPFLSLLFIFLFLFIATKDSQGRTITVEQEGGGEYETIIEAVEISENGDIVEVGPGNYSGSFFINHSLTLRSTSGPEQTTLFPEYYEEDGTFRVVNITTVPVIASVNSHNVTIQGFTFSALPVNVTYNKTNLELYFTLVIALRLNDTSDVTIEGNDFLAHPAARYKSGLNQSFMHGISQSDGNPTNLRIVNNTAHSLLTFCLILNGTTISVQDNSASDLTFFFSGTSLSDVLVEGNNVTNISSFVSVSHIFNITVQNNHITGTSILSYSGVFFAECGDVVCNWNTISNFYTGVMGLRSYGFIINHNVFRNNINDITIEEVFDCLEIENNTFLSPTQTGYGNYSITITSSRCFSIENNTMTNRSQALISQSSNFTFSNNHLLNTELDLDEAHPNNATGNTINGRDIVFLIDTDAGIHSLPQAGQIFVIGCKDLKVQDISISDMNKALVIMDSDNVIVQNASITNSTSFGIHIMDSKYCGVISSRFTDCNWGVYAEDADGFYIIGSTFQSCRVGTDIRSTDLVTLFISSFQGGEIGLNLNDVSLAQITTCDFAGLDFAIKTLHSENLNISACNISGSSVSGIHLYMGINVLMEGNTFYDCGTAIELISFPNGTIMRNDIRQYTGYGITVNATSENTHIENNTITGPGTTGYGLFIQYSNNNTVDGNVISRNKYGIFLENSSRNIFTANDITRNTLGVFLSSYILGAIFQNNTIANNTLGAQALDTIGTADMSWNYWGDPSGPHHSANNSHGKGDKITDSIEFLPFQSFPGEPLPDEPSEDGEDEDFFLGLSRSWFLMLVDVGIILAVVVLFFIGFRREGGMVGKGKERKGMRD